MVVSQFCPLDYKLAFLSFIIPILIFNALPFCPCFVAGKHFGLFRLCLGSLERPVNVRVRNHGLFICFFIIEIKFALLIGLLIYALQPAFLTFSSSPDNAKAVWAMIITTSLKSLIWRVAS